MKYILTASAAIVLAFTGLAFGQAGGPYSAPAHRTFMGPSLGELYQPESSLMAGVNAQTGTTYTVLGSDSGKLLTLSNASAVAVTLPQAGTPGFEVNKTFYVLNKGAGLVTITPTTSNIMGVSSVVLANGDGIDLVSDGTNYQPEGGLTNSRSCTVTGGGPVTCNGVRGVATTGTLTTAARVAAAGYVINNSSVTAASVVSCDLGVYSGTFVTNGTPIIGQCVPGAGTITVTIVNVDTTNALNGTVAIDFAVLN